MNISPPSDDDTTNIRRAIEAVLFVAREPLPADRLAEIVGTSPAKTTEILQALVHAYAGRGFVLQEIEEGYHFVVAPATHDIVRAYLFVAT